MAEARPPPESGALRRGARACAAAWRPGSSGGGRASETHPRPPHLSLNFSLKFKLGDAGISRSSSELESTELDYFVRRFHGTGDGVKGSGRRRG